MSCLLGFCHQAPANFPGSRERYGAVMDSNDVYWCVPGLETKHTLPVVSSNFRSVRFPGTHGLLLAVLWNAGCLVDTVRLIRHATLASECHVD